jgi:predicted RNA methylase
MLWEYRLGINSRGIVYGATESDFHHYSTVSYRSTMAILRNLSLKPSDVFVDIGCGKGRVLCCASRYRIQEVIGIEVDKTLCDIAKCNAKKVHGRKSSINVINVSAEEYDYRIGTVYYLFNPFGASTLNAVLAKMEQAVRLKPRKLKIVYVNSVHDIVLNRCDWLEMYDRWEAGKQFGLMHDVSFWRTKDLKNVT